MLYAILVATLVTLFASSVAFVIQLILNQRRASRIDRGAQLRALALEHGGTLTPRVAAEALGLSVYQADGLLRSQVDDRRVRMRVDELEGALRFTFED